LTVDTSATGHISAAEAFGQRLVQAMRAKRVKNPDVAAALGVHVITVSKWRTGTQPIEPARLGALAEFLDVPESWLRSGAEAVQESVRVRDDARADVVRGDQPRHARNLPLSVREYLAELRLRLTKGGADDEEIDEAMDLLRSPQLFTFYKGGAPSEYNDADVLRGMKGIAESIIIPELNERGRKIQ
jgi:transcriptional regulator with XRE-family HTH domain